MEIRLFYDIFTGEVFLVNNMYKKTSFEHDQSVFKELTKRHEDTYSYVDISLNQYEQDFAESNGYRVNPETKELEFSYPDPNEPEAPPVYQKPLSEEVEEVKAQNVTLSEYMLDVDFRLIMIELGL